MLNLMRSPGDIYSPGDKTIFNCKRSYVIKSTLLGLILTMLFYVSNIIYPLKNKIEM